MSQKNLLYNYDTASAEVKKITHKAHRLITTAWKTFAYVYVVNILSTLKGLISTNSLTTFSRERLG